MVRPIVNTIKADIKNVSIYLRSTKKFGKTTLFRDVIIEKYGNASKGLLIACGSEKGYTMLDNLNYVQVRDYAELTELVDWLINEKGKEHNIEIVAFDTVDELALIADSETIRIANKENPTKKVRSIKAAMGGFTAGEKYSANDVIKPLINRVRDAGFGVWGIAHTKFKTIKTKGSTDAEGYMQLTSNLGADYESAFGDIFDVVLTGVTDRAIEEKEINGDTKRFTKEITRKLYFRETELIDAGGRFSFGTVPEYLVFDKPNMAKEFIKTVEEGMEKSKMIKDDTSQKAVTPIETIDIPEEEDIEEIEPTEEEVIDEIIDDEPITMSIEELRAKVTSAIKGCTDIEKKKAVTAYVRNLGKKVSELTVSECEKAKEIIA